MEANKAAVVSKLKKRIKEKGEFPAISKATISLIKQQTSRSDPSVSDVAKVVLDDFGLTKKILSLVNSGYYANFQLNGKIDSVSQAVFILGYEQVKNAAISLSMLEPLSNSTLTLETKDAFLSSFMSASIAKQVARKVKDMDQEVAFVCAMFHNLGKLLVSYYMPELSKEITGYRQKTGVGDSSASFSVLGLSYEEIGITLSKEWSISDDIVNTMGKLPDIVIPRPTSQEGWIHAVVSFSNTLCFKINEIKGTHGLLKKLLDQYANCFTLTTEEVSEILNVSMEEIKKHSEILNISLSEIPFLNMVNTIALDAQFDSFYEASAVAPVWGEEVKVPDCKHVVDTGNENICSLDAQDFGGEETLSLTEETRSLSRFIVHDVAGMLIERKPFEDILCAILKIMVETIGFTRAVFCLRTSQEPFMEGILGNGPDTQKALKSFKLELNKERNIFTIALSKNMTISVKDINDPRIVRYIPQWYKQEIPSQNMIIFPIVMGNEPVALFYVDKADSAMPAPTQLQQIHTLILQASIAIYPEVKNIAYKTRNELLHNKYYWLNLVMSALRSSTLIPFFQPIVRNPSAITEKFECLARIAVDDKIIVPGKFIKYAKQAGFIPLITMEIIRKSMTAFKGASYDFSINIKDEDINDETIFNFLQGLQLPAAQRGRMFLEVQLSENASKAEDFRYRLKEVRAKGIKIAIDNFGSLKSDIACLMELKADYIKVGSQFITKIHSSPRHYNAVKAITSYARKMQMQVIANFVSDKGIQEDVLKLGIDYSQGYYFSPPVISISS